MSNHLFLFTIGPVQSFIAQARKTQDLYAGSRLLSVLTRKAIETVQQDKGKIIFPDPDLDSLPNRFVAKVDLPEDHLQAFGQKVEAAVRAEWERIAYNGLLEQGLKARNFTIPNGFAEQIKQHLEVYWVFTPISDEQDGYQKAFKEIVTLLAGVKQTAYFEQNKETGRKCSVDGQRNVKFYRYSENQHRNNWGEIRIRETHLFSDDNVIIDFEENGIPLAVLQPGEGLSGVSFVKRGYRENGNNEEFPSTADIALLKSIHYWKEASLDIDYKSYKKAFEEVHFDAQLLFEDNLTEQYFKKQSLNKVLEKIKLPDLKELLQKFKGKSPHPQTKYYAILRFDGDGMGELLSGERLTNPQDLEKFHGVFSTQLGTFAAEARKYLYADQRGRTVYAGGDDFLGFVNLESLFDVLIEFRRLYDDKVNKNDFVKKFLKEDTEITFSAGICIAHYKEPLSLVLNRARAMEQKAKDYRKSKNAFGIAVIKGSGEDHDTVWGFENDSVKTLQYLVEQLRDETFSNTFIKKFQRTFALLQDLNEPVPEEMLNMYCTELLRLAERSANQQKYSKEERKVKAKELVTKLWDELYHRSENVSLENFFEMLNICDFLHRTLNPVNEKANAESTN